jgi:hypothetical protein
MELMWCYFFMFCHRLIALMTLKQGFFQVKQKQDVHHGQQQQIRESRFEGTVAVGGEADLEAAQQDSKSGGHPSKGSNTVTSTKDNDIEAGGSSSKGNKIATSTMDNNSKLRTPGLMEK